MALADSEASDADKQDGECIGNLGHDQNFFLAFRVVQTYTKSNQGKVTRKLSKQVRWEEQHQRNVVSVRLVEMKFDRHADDFSLRDMISVKTGM
jgi:hypothetical protein